MEFYKNNPFEKPIPYRLQAFNTSQLTAQQQFIKNLIAYVYYIHKDPIYTLEENSSKLKFSEDELLEMFQNLELYTYLEDGNPESITSLLGIYWEYEICNLLEYKEQPDIKTYFDAILDFNDTIEKIDAIIEDRTPFAKSKLHLEDYYKQNNIKTEYLDVDKIELLYYSIASNILDNLSLAAIRDLSFTNKPIPLLLIEDYIKQLNYYLNPKLLSYEDLQQLHQASFNWFEQNLSDILFFLEIEDDALFEELRTRFLSILKIEPTANTIEESKKKQEGLLNASVDYPIHVFKTAEAYDFFDTCAKQLTSIKTISFLYRRMAEQQKLIYLKDKAFRDWFNQKSYPVYIDYPTATYDRAATKEREELFGLMEEFYGKAK